MSSGGVERTVTVQYIVTVTLRCHQYIAVSQLSQSGYEVCLPSLMLGVGQYDAIVSQRIAPQHCHPGILLSYPYVTVAVLVYVGKIVSIKYRVGVFCREVLDIVICRVIYI